ncbi:hypothetical protein ACSHWO_01780 [Streptomyces sp. HUAS TT3]|uniref:hypothetical protein n=1 Tax=Streptomyces sp. HUAS TT3 TaxID=3447510 RepID=UPI003F65BC5B
MKPGHCSRAARAAIFAAVCVLLAATGHVLMSDTAVPWWALLPAFAGTSGAAWALAGRERGQFAVAITTVAVQAVLHAGFSLAQSLLRPPLPPGSPFARQWAAYLLCGERTPTGTTMAGPHAHHAVDTMAAAAAAAAGTGPHTTGHDMAGMSPGGMLAAHLLAAVLCGLWLGCAERSVFRCLRALAGWLRAPLRVLFGLLAPVPHRPHPRVRRARYRGALRELLLVHAITSRGPPRGTAVA